MLYRNRVFTYYDKLLISQQYEEISHINNLLNDKVMTDDLTKMNNRRYLEDILQKINQPCKSRTYNWNDDRYRLFQTI